MVQYLTITDIHVYSCATFAAVSRTNEAEQGLASFIHISKELAMTHSSSRFTFIQSIRSTYIPRILRAVFRLFLFKISINYRRVFVQLD